MFTLRSLRLLSAVRTVRPLPMRTAHPFASFASRPARFTSTTSPPKSDDLVQDDILEAEKKARDGAFLKGSEQAAGPAQQYAFQAETRKLLDIVACSLYTDKEIFIRELISNASDAIAKLRFHLATDTAAAFDPAASARDEILLAADPKKRTLMIQDFGIGMTADELRDNLGTIARSGTQEFARKMEAGGTSGSDAAHVIGQFGVGFYSVFMVCKRARVYSRSAMAGSQGYLWESDGSGVFTLTPCDGVAIGTKIELELKDTEMSFAEPSVVDTTIRKYSNFVPCAIMLNGRRVNTIDALWMRQAKSVTPDEHKAFYRFLTSETSEPLFTLQFRAEGPVNANVVLYAPAKASRQQGYASRDSGVALYSRKVLIQAKSRLLLPEWLRFMVGVVDSEDLPLNISREHTQDSPIVRKLSSTVTKRAIRWLQEEAAKQPEKFNAFYAEFGPHFKEAVVSDLSNRAEVARLLRYPSIGGQPTAGGAREVTSLDAYIERMPPQQKAIFYLLAPDTVLAKQSPYVEQFVAQGVEVLVLPSDADAFVFAHLDAYKRLKTVNVESAEAGRLMGEHRAAKAKADAAAAADGKPAADKPAEEAAAAAGGRGGEFDVPLSSAQAAEVAKWLQTELRDRVGGAKASDRLVTSAIILCDHENASMRRIVRMYDPSQGPGKQVYNVEFNAGHASIRRLHALATSADPAAREKAKLLGNVLVDTAVISAGLLEDARSILPRIGSLLSAAFDTPAPSAAAATPAPATAAAPAAASGKAAAEPSVESARKPMGSA